jgi:hypothetical protein
VLPKINIALSFVFLALFLSCGLTDKVDQIDPEKIIYRNYAIESLTNINGELDIETTFPDDALNILYNLKVVNKVGEPVEGISVVYNQEHGKSILFIKDKLKRYNSAFLYGTPLELNNVFSTSGDESATGTEQSQAVYGIGLDVSVIPLNEAELKTIPDAYKIQQYCCADSTFEGNDYLIYCKAIEEIPEMIKERIDLTFNSTSILISIVSPDYHELIEISSEKILDESFNFGDKLISKASDQWGLRIEEIIGDLIAIKSYFPLQSDKLAYVETLFEYYQIELENSKCQKYIVGVPEEVNEFLNTDFIDILEGKGLFVNNGLAPTNITGNYFADTWTNLESGTRYVNYSFQFLNQTTRFQIEVRSAAEFSDATGIVAYISGDGPNFSIYSEQDHNINDGGHTVYIKTADIYSGELMQGGILNFQNGFIILQKENDLYDRFLNVGDSRVVYEADFFADAVDTFPYASTDLDPDNSFRRAISETN